MPDRNRARLRVAAIDFLNPAPLLWDFEHAPGRERLLERYDVRYTSPAQCAEQLRMGEADLGLVPIGAMPFLPGVSAVPGCAIASRRRVRSIQLVLRPGVTLGTIGSLAADAASRSSVAYVRVLLRISGVEVPPITTLPASLETMLAGHDAALLIGDPALLATERRDQTGAYADCTWIDLAEWWHRETGLPWVAAVWAVRTAALPEAGVSANVLEADLCGSRDRGLRHIGELVREWQGRIAVSRETIQAYLTTNIDYVLDTGCLRAVDRFYSLAASTGVLPQYTFRML